MLKSALLRLQGELLWLQALLGLQVRLSMQLSLTLKKTTQSAKESEFSLAQQQSAKESEYSFAQQSLLEKQGLLAQTPRLLLFFALCSLCFPSPTTV